jgi:hypothetical protein
VDTTQATAANRILLYVNGDQVSAFSTSSDTSLNFDTAINTTTAHRLGAGVDSGGGLASYFDGYLTNIHFIDGQALTPSSFTETDATTGQLIPKTYTGSYGTNGFNLLFADNSSNTASTLGKDTSGNSNNWTPNNLSVTAGAGNDSLVDSPTSYGTDTGVGGEVRGNYATLNALALNGNTLSNGNLDYLAGGNNKPTLTTIGIPASGKWYIEITDVNSGNGSFIGGVGTASANVGTYLGADANGWSYQTHASNAGYFNNNTFTTTGRINGHGSNTILGIAIDRDAQKIWFAINGTFVNSGAPASGTNAQYSNLPTSGELFAGGSTGTGQNITFNGGQRAFAYTAPSGFKALCDTNLPAPLVAKPSTVFDVITYTGTGSSLTLPNGSSTPTSIAFTPDFVWLKGRSGATDHAIYDSVRDVQKDLVSNSTAAETTQTTGLTAFGTNTFTVGSLAKLNTSSATYVGWCWDAGTGSPVSNPDGSITSQVRANATAGFSVVTFTASGTAGSDSCGHGLGVTPGLVIIKRRDSADDWYTWHKSFSNLQRNYLLLNSTAAVTLSGNDSWGAGMTSSVIGFRSQGVAAGNMVAYCFTPVVGYSSFGSYTGNGSADGPFVYTGFRPRWLMIKVTNISNESWVMKDSARGTYNPNEPNFYADLSAAEQTSNSSRYIDFTSNGFKLRGTEVSVNGSSNTYVYIAFAESPFNYSRAR